MDEADHALGGDGTNDGHGAWNLHKKLGAILFAQTAMGLSYFESSLPRTFCISSSKKTPAPEKFVTIC
jgi:hypothetical protein